MMMGLRAGTGCVERESASNFAATLLQGNFFFFRCVWTGDVWASTSMREGKS